MRKRKIQANAEIQAFSHNSKVAKSEPAWGTVDKGSLPRMAFADQGQAGEKSTWSYPHHFVENGGGLDKNGIYTTGDMYLHQGGLNAAWAAAQGARSGQKASADVIAHLQAHRKALGLNTAAEEGNLKACRFECTPTFVEAAAGADGKPGLPKFTMVANTGAQMRLWGWDAPVIVDMAGVNIRSQALPIRRGHDSMTLVGHTDSVKVEGGQILASGVISFSTPAAQEIVQSAKNGFPWQASIGASVESAEFVEQGMEAEANGMKHKGPVYIARASSLDEISFVDIGADRNTSVSVAAQRKPQEEDQPMKLTEEQKKAITASRALLKAGKFVEAAKAIEAHADLDHEDFVTLRGEIEAAESKAKKIEAQADPVADFRASMAAEKARIAEVTKAAGKHDGICAQAIGEGWSVDKTELAVLRAERSVTPTRSSAGSDVASGDLLECAAMQASGVPMGDLVQKHGYKKETVEAADKRFRGRMGLQQMLLAAAHANGYTGDSVRTDLRGVLEAAFRPIQGAFSTLSLPGIFSNLLNKRLEDGFMGVEAGWREIAAIRPVNDFKEVTSYRLSGSMQYERVAPDGEIKHGLLGEKTYGNKADTYGKMFSITRQDIINDDLGALMQIPMRLGRGAALALNEVFWREWLTGETSGFFSAGNNNLDATTASLFGIDGLTLAERKFLDQTDPDGKPLGLAPAIILVPNALSTPANQVMKATELRDTTASTKFVTNNPHMGKFQVVRSSYLNTPALPGGSPKHWYLIGRPVDMAAVEVAFLNGQQTPTVETAQADFNTLGIQARGFHDFGVRLQEPRAAQKLRGEA